MVEQVHQAILNMLVTKYRADKVSNYIDRWGETLADIAWAIRSLYQQTIQAKKGQYVFGRDMIFNLASFVDWQVKSLLNCGKWTLIMSRKTLGESHMTTQSEI